MHWLTECPQNRQGRSPIPSRGTAYGDVIQASRWAPPDIRVEDKPQDESDGLVGQLNTMNAWDDDQRLYIPQGHDGNLTTEVQPELHATAFPSHEIEDSPQTPVPEPCVQGKEGNINQPPLNNNVISAPDLSDASAVDISWNTAPEVIQRSPSGKYSSPSRPRIPLMHFCQPQLKYSVTRRGKMIHTSQVETRRTHSNLHEDVMSVRHWMRSGRLKPRPFLPFSVDWKSLNLLRPSLAREATVQSFGSRSTTTRSPHRVAARYPKRSWAGPMARPTKRGYKSLKKRKERGHLNVVIPRLHPCGARQVPYFPENPFHHPSRNTVYLYQDMQSKEHQR